MTKGWRTRSRSSWMRKLETAKRTIPINGSAMATEADRGMGVGTRSAYMGTAQRSTANLANGERALQQNEHASLSWSAGDRPNGKPQLECSLDLCLVVCQASEFWDMGVRSSYLGKMGQSNKRLRVGSRRMRQQRSHPGKSRLLLLHHERAGIMNILWDF